MRRPERIELEFAMLLILTCTPFAYRAVRDFMALVAGQKRTAGKSLRTNQCERLGHGMGRVGVSR